jgi:Peptidase of plants and bacteria
MTSASSKPTPRPHPPIPSLPRTPLLRLEIRDLSSKGSRAFLALPDPGSILKNAVDAVLAWLYTPTSHIPPTRSITLILRDMPGVAYTTGSDLDSDHKEIHFSTGYIEGIAKERFEDEVLGVVTHEMVHCWQWVALGTCPGGLVEGIADFVRLKAGFVPPHWRKESSGEWDAGYQHTGYFLDFLERKYGDGTVVKINEHLRDREYKEEIFWEECCGCGVKELWEEYGKHLKKEGEDRSNYEEEEGE